MQTIELHHYRVSTVRDRDFRLDGGAMFGVVPRVLWEKLEPPDPVDHTVPLATRGLLIEGAAGGPILIEPGIGDRWSEKSRSIFKINDSRNINNSLRGLGLAPEDVRTVILTHFHLDHAGAAVTTDTFGACAPRFTRARHVVAKIELDACLCGEGARRASYRSDDASTLRTAGLLDTFDGAALEVAPGIVVHRVGGHSPGVCIVTINDGGRTVCFWSDVVPTRNHIHPFYIMAYDADAEESYRVRRPWIERAVSEKWVNCLYHDPSLDFVRFEREGERFFASAVES